MNRTAFLFDIDRTLTPSRRIIIENNLGFVYNVANWKETYNILKEIESAIP